MRLTLPCLLPHGYNSLETLSFLKEVTFRMFEDGIDFFHYTVPKIETGTN